MALALEIGVGVVLIDEAAGRRVAKELGLKPLGVLGVLAHAKRARLVGQVGPLITRLENELDFRISPEVRRAALEMAGE